MRPVRIAFGYTRDIQIVDDAQQVFQLYGVKLAATQCAVFMQSCQQGFIGFCRHLYVCTQTAGFFQFIQQIGFIVFAFIQGRLKSGCIRQSTEFEHRIQIFACPIARQGRNIVGTDDRNRLLRVFFRQLETVPALAEIHYFVREHLIAVEQMAGFVGYRTQILADNDATVAPAFQRQNSKHHFGIVMHIRAEIRRFTV